jgi:hypothetical protein
MCSTTLQDASSKLDDAFLVSRLLSLTICSIEELLLPIDVGYFVLMDVKDNCE